MRAAALLKQESAGHTLQPTALVHEAFMKLAPQAKAQIQNDSQALALAAMATLAECVIEPVTPSGHSGAPKAPIASGIATRGHSRRSRSASTPFVAQ